MIEVRYDLKAHSLEVRGHADYAPVGHDIVCAGASILAFTLVESLLGMKDFQTCYPEYLLEKGDASIKFFPKEEFAQYPNIVFTSILKGFEILEKNYPNHIKIIGSGLEMT